MKPTAVLIAVILMPGSILFVGCSFNAKKKAETATHGSELILPEVLLTEKEITPLPQPDPKEADSQKAVKIKQVKPHARTVKVEGGDPCGGPAYWEDDHSDSIWHKVEFEAEYPGGAAAWQRFLNKNMRYPEEDIENEIQTSVLVQFVVDKEGNVSEVEAIEGSEALSKEAVRVIKKSGRWIPAVQNGCYIKSLKKQPFIICLKAEE